MWRTSGDVAALFDLAEERFGGVDVVVNTAGIMLRRPLAELELDDFDRMHRTNMRGTFVVAQQAARRLRAGGAIINFSSSVTKLAPPTYAAYAATKGAVEAMTHILAQELRGKNITVNAVAPGPTATACSWTAKRPTGRADGQTAPLERLGPAGRHRRRRVLPGRPDGGWVNGQDVCANGGIV